MADVVLTQQIPGPPGAAGASVAGTGFVQVLNGGLVSPASYTLKTGSGVAFVQGGTVPSPSALNWFSAQPTDNTKAPFSGWIIDGVFNGQDDSVLTYGYNSDNEVPGEPMARFNIEQHYIPTPGTHLFEMYWELKTSGGGSPVRPFFANYNRGNGASSSICAFGLQSGDAWQVQDANNTVYAIITQGAPANAFLANSTQTNLNGKTQVNLQVNGAQILNVAPALMSSGVAIALPGNAALSGDLRFASSRVIAAIRNSANTADIPLMQTDSANDFWIGHTTPSLSFLTVQAYAATSIYLNAGTGIIVGPNVVTLGGGSGGLLALSNITTPPTANPTLGILVWSGGGTSFSLFGTSGSELDIGLSSFAGSSPGLSQPSTAAATAANLNLQPQQSTAGSNRVQGNLLVTLATGTGTGSNGWLQLQDGVTGGPYTVHVQAGPAIGLSGGGALYLGGGLTPGNSNYAIACDASITHLNAPGSVLDFEFGATVYMQLNQSTNLLLASIPVIQWTSITNAPGLNQISTSSSSGQTMTVQAQNSTLAAGNGGVLNLTSGFGGGSGLPGATNLQVGGVSELTVGPNGLSYGTSNVTIASTGNTTFTQAQYQSPLISINSITLTGAVTLILPNVAGVWLVDISLITLGGFTVAFKSGTATSATISSIPGTTQVVMVRTTGSNGISINA